MSYGYTPFIELQHIAEGLALVTFHETAGELDFLVKKNAAHVVGKNWLSLYRKDKFPEVHDSLVGEAGDLYSVSPSMSARTSCSSADSFGGQPPAIGTRGSGQALSGACAPEDTPVDDDDYRYPLEASACAQSRGTLLNARQDARPLPSIPLGGQPSAIGSVQALFGTCAPENTPVDDHDDRCPLEASACAQSRGPSSLDAQQGARPLLSIPLGGQPSGLGSDSARGSAQALSGTLPPENTPVDNHDDRYPLEASACAQRSWAIT